MALLDTLTTGFSQGGFSLDTTMAGVKTDLEQVKPSGASLDQGEIGRIGDRLGQADLGPIGGAVQTVAAVAGTVGAGLPVVGDLLQPLQGAIGTAQTLTSSNTLQLLATLEQAGAGSPGAVGLGGLAAPLRALDEARAGGPVADTLKLLTGLVPGGLDLEGAIAALGGRAGGVLGLVQLLGALMAADTLTREIDSSASLVAGMLDPGQVDGALGRIDLWTDDTTLVQRVAAVDPDDEAAVAALVEPVTEVAESIRAAAELLVGGLAFGEATLVHAELPRLVAELGASSALLSESALPPVRQLATDARARLEPVLQLDFGAPADSFEAFLGELEGIFGDLGAAVDRIDPAVLAAPLTGILGNLLGSLNRVVAVAEEARAAFQSTFQTIHQAIAAVDLRPVAEAIGSALQPAVDALAAVQALVGDAQQAIEAASQATIASLADVKKSLGDAADLVHGAYQRVADTIEALHLDELEEEIRDGIGEVVTALHGAQLRPYFDASIDVMTTAVDVVSKVPVDLLPDDVRKDLDQAVAPIKQIDFDTAIKQELEGQLQDILNTLDTDVLDEVAQAYAEVLAFLTQINPRAGFEQLEQEAFDPLLERLAAIDPAEVLQPVSGVLDTLKDALQSLDLKADVLDPLDAVFDELAAAFASFDPGQAIAPLVQEVDELSKTITETLQLDAALEQLDGVGRFVDRVLARVDFDALVAVLDAAWDRLRPAPGEGGPSPLGTVIGSVAEGTGLAVRADALDTVSSWLAGADAGTEVQVRLAGAVTALEAGRQAAERSDLQALSARLQPLYRDLLAAVESHPEGSLLRRRLDATLSGAAPADLFGPHVDNQARYAAALDEALGSLRSAAGSGRSELKAVADGLREALRPLTALPDKLRALLARFGVEVDGLSLGDILRGLFDRLEPSSLLAPLSAAVAALKDKLSALVRDGLVGPVRGAVSDLQQLIATIDISFLVADLQTIHDDVLAQIQALKPSTLLAPLVASVEGTRQTILAFDPLGAARAAVDALKEAIVEIANDFRPTTIFAPILDLYDHILQIAGGLDVRNLLEPILSALHDLEAQLDDGLDRTADALGRLQAALP
jgi:hypothetical protein